MVLPSVRAGLCAAVALCALVAPAGAQVGAEAVEEGFEVLGADAPAGWARLARGRDDDGAFRVELELELFAHEVVLHQVERTAPREQEVVYRERRAGGGRTLRVQWSGGPHDAVAERVEWAGRERLAAWRGGPRPTTPLLAAEAARRASPPVGATAHYVPSADAEESWRVAERRVRAGRGCSVPTALLPRLVTWRGDDGGVRAWRLYAGSELLAFGFGSGGPVAVRCSAERVAELRASSPRTTPLADRSPATPIAGH